MRIICWIFGHKYREQGVFRDDVPGDWACIHCGFNPVWSEFSYCLFNMNGKRPLYVENE